MVAQLNCGADLPAFWYWRYLGQYWPKFYANCFPWFLEEIEIDQYPLAPVVCTTSAPFRLHARWIFAPSIRRNLGEMTKSPPHTCMWFAKRIWIIGCLAQAWRQISKSAGTVHALLLLAVAPLSPRTLPFREAKSHPVRYLEIWRRTITAGGTALTRVMLSHKRRENYTDMCLGCLCCGTD